MSSNTFGNNSLYEDGSALAIVLGWGVNEDFQLGLDSKENVFTPKVVEALLGKCLRRRTLGKAPLVAGSRNTLAVTSDGDVFSWGWNDRATLGQGHRQLEKKPRRVAALREYKIEQVALGGWHCLAVDDKGQIFSWGGNEYGQCALPSDLRDVQTPQPILSHLQVEQVACGGMSSLALTVDGQLWMWGEPWGDFSLSVDRSPRRIDNNHQFVRIASGAFHHLAVDRHGRVFSWGINDFGQLGIGTTNYATEPEKVVDLDDVCIVDIAAGGWHSVAITDSGEVYVWGRGEYGRLGLGDKSGSSKLRPQKLKGLEGHRVIEASCGGTHSMVVTDEGKVFTWGRGAFGRQGTGNEKDCLSPIEVKLPGGPERWHVLSAAAGGRHSLILAVPDNDLPDKAVAQKSWSLKGTSEEGASPIPSIRPTNSTLNGGSEGDSSLLHFEEEGDASEDDGLDEDEDEDEPLTPTGTRSQRIGSNGRPPSRLGTPLMNPSRSQDLRELSGLTALGLRDHTPSDNP